MNFQILIIDASDWLSRLRLQIAFCVYDLCKPKKIPRYFSVCSISTIYIVAVCFVIRVIQHGKKKGFILLQSARRAW